MKATLHILISVQKAISKLEDFLSSNEFTFEVEDIKYDVQCKDNAVEKNESRVDFWSMRYYGGQFKVSIIIQGYIEKNNDETIMEIELFEDHSRRRHPFSDSPQGDILNEYLDKITNLFIINDNTE